MADLDAPVAAPSIMRKAAAECLGTFLLVFFAVGSAVVGLKSTGNVGVALSFGLVLLALAYAIGPITGCHVNPAVTLGVLLCKGVTTTEAVYYWVAQFVGGIIGGAMLKLMVSAFGVTDETGALGSNGWGTAISVGGDFVFEVILTFLLVFVVLLVTARQAAPGFAGLAIGLSLTVIHLTGIPVDGTSVNPARSLGPALFAGGQALSQVWLYILAPMVGGAIAAFISPLFITGPVDEKDPTGATTA